MDFLTQQFGAGLIVRYGGGPQCGQETSRLIPVSMVDRAASQYRPPGNVSSTSVGSLKPCGTGVRTAEPRWVHLATQVTSMRSQRTLMRIS